MSLGFLLLQGGEVTSMTVTLNTLFERASDEYVISHGYPVPQQFMHTKTRVQAVNYGF